MTRQSHTGLVSGMHNRLSGNSSY